jgi:cysteine-rich repeat protein
MNDRSIAALAIALASCSSSPMPPDGGGDAGGPPPNTVIGRSFTRCHQIGGDVERPDDLSGAVIQALVPDGGPTGYRIVAGHGKPDGSFTIESVPDGVTYLLEYSPPDSIKAYYVTARHDISIFVEASGRCAPAPAISYRIDVKRVTPQGGTSSVALLRTADTSLRIPASLLGDGEFFVFLISATRSAADYGAGQISATVLPLEFASLASGRFRFSATCGDTVVQPGEDCDGGGETATCNRDCTTPFCGDGLRNAAAGEDCDTVEDALGCDSDCTLPVCGDRHVNTAAGEDCDDGNQDNTDHCSTDCKILP